MLRKLPLLFLLFPFYSLTAQDKPKVLLSGNDIEIAGFGGMMVEFSSIEGKASISTGGGGAAIFNEVFFIGGYGLNLANDLNKYAAGNLWEVAFTQGGLYMGYLIHSHKMIHFGISSRTGWGILRIYPENGYLSSAAPTSDNVFVWTPQAEVEMNVATWFKVNAGIGHRSVAGMNNSFFSKRDFNSPALMLSFLFGSFK